MHCHVSGVADNEADSDESCLRMTRAYLAYFPTNVWSRPPRVSRPATIPSGATRRRGGGRGGPRNTRPLIIRALRSARAGETAEPKMRHGIMPCPVAGGSASWARTRP